MKTKWITIALVVALAFFCADTAAAKDKKAKKETMYPALLTTSDIKGANVINLQNENIGNIDELLIEADTGHISDAICFLRLPSASRSNTLRESSPLCERSPR